jgi:hypothetical protein
MLFCSSAWKTAKKDTISLDKQRVKPFSFCITLSSTQKAKSTAARPKLLLIEIVSSISQKKMACNMQIRENENQLLSCGSLADRQTTH